MDRRLGTTVALKKIFDAFENPTDAQRTFREIMFLRALHGHPNVVQLLDVMPADNDRDIYLVFDYMDTDLHAAIRADILHDVHKRYIMYQLLRAIKYMHSGELVHRDVKPSNILLDTDCHVKIADFGLARSLGTRRKAFAAPVLTDYVATRWYRAPEVLLGSSTYTKGIDLWSLGCIHAELLTGRPLFPGTSTLNQLERIIDAIGAPAPEDVDMLGSPFAATILEAVTPRRPTRSLETLLEGKASPEAVELLRLLLQFNPEKRISAEDALNHPYVADFRQNSEPVCRRLITLPLDDNQKLTTHQYRDALYSKVFRARPHATSNVPTTRDTPPRQGGVCAAPGAATMPLFQSSSAATTTTLAPAYTKTTWQQPPSCVPTRRHTPIPLTHGLNIMSHAAQYHPYHFLRRRATPFHPIIPSSQYVVPPPAYRRAAVAGSRVYGS